MGRDVWCHPVLTRSKSPRLPDKLLAVAGVSYTGKLVQQELGLHRCDIDAAGGTEDDMFVDIAVIYCITSLREQTFFVKLLHYKPPPNWAVAVTNSFTQYCNRSRGY